MEATIRIGGREMTIRGLTWTEIKTWNETGLDLRNLNQLLETDDGHEGLEKIIIEHSDLTVEMLGAMQIDELLLVYDGIIRLTVEAAKIGVEAITGQASSRKNLFHLIEGGIRDGR